MIIFFFRRIIRIIRIGIGWNSNAFMYMFLYKLLWNWKPNFIMMKLTLQVINMFNYFCLRLSHFSKNFIKGDVIGTGFFHSVLLISMGLRFCDWTSRLISILHSFHSRAKKLNYLPPYFVLFTNIHCIGVIYLIYFQLGSFELRIVPVQFLFHIQMWTNGTIYIKFYYTRYNNFKKSQLKIPLPFFHNLIETFINLTKHDFLFVAG